MYENVCGSGDYEATGPFTHGYGNAKCQDSVEGDFESS